MACCEVVVWVGGRGATMRKKERGRNRKGKESHYLAALLRLVDDFNMSLVQMKMTCSDCIFSRSEPDHSLLGDKNEEPEMGGASIINTQNRIRLG